MLCVDRAEQQSILIGDDIEVLIVEVHGKRVRIAIQAPREVLILRKELLVRGSKPREIKENDLQV